MELFNLNEETSHSFINEKQYQTSCSTSPEYGTYEIWWDITRTVINFIVL